MADAYTRLKKIADAQPFNCAQCLVAVEDLRELLAAKEPEDNTWREWAGGENPAGGRRVNATTRGGVNFHDWSSEVLQWQHTGAEADIIAWRYA